MEGEHVGPFNLGNPGEFTMLELAKVGTGLVSNVVERLIQDRPPSIPIQLLKLMTKNIFV